MHSDQWASKEALRVHHKDLMKLPLQDLLPELYSDGLITEETQERIAHPRAVFIKREANQLILQDVKQAVSNQPEHLDRFCKSLLTLQPAVGLSQRIKGMLIPGIVQSCTHAQICLAHMHTHALTYTNIHGQVHTLHAHAHTHMQCHSFMPQTPLLQIVPVVTDRKDLSSSIGHAKQVMHYIHHMGTVYSVIPRAHNEYKSEGVGARSAHTNDCI